MMPARRFYHPDGSRLYKSMISGTDVCACLDESPSRGVDPDMDRAANVTRKVGVARTGKLGRFDVPRRRNRRKLKTGVAAPTDVPHARCLL